MTEPKNFLDNLLRPAPPSSISIFLMAFVPYSACRGIEPGAAAVSSLLVWSSLKSRGSKLQIRSRPHLRPRARSSLASQTDWRDYARSVSSYSSSSFFSSDSRHRSTIAASGEEVHKDDHIKQVLVGRYGVLSSKPLTQPRLKVVDLRSDTVTKPTEEMRLAMFEAEVGDDVFGEDPTVNKLEERAAEMLGKEAALFVPSGTMANLLCVMVHCPGRGEEVLLGDCSHMSKYEQGGIAQLAGVYPRTVKNLPDGTLDLEEVVAKLQTDTDFHLTITRLVCVENTHNFMGGRVVPLEFMDKLAELVCEKGVKIHMDGARLFNAATALQLPPSKLVEHADSISFCLSKGLCAPIGSMVVGGRDFIAIARRLRKALGGGMRQAGVIAAPGLIALEKMSKRLQVDHDNAKKLAKGLAAMKDLGVHIDLTSVQTNIVIFSLKRDDISSEEFIQRLEEVDEDGKEQVCVQLMAFPGAADPSRIRATTHYEVNVDLALKKIKRILK